MARSRFCSFRLSLGMILSGILMVQPSMGWSAQDHDLLAVKKAGKLLVAIDPTYPPMEFEGKDGKPIGFDIDIASEVAKRLGVKAEFMLMNWDGIMAGLASHRYDIIISSMNITEDRKKQVAFVEYMQMAQVFVSKAGTSQVKTETDLAGKVIAVQADTTSYNAVQEAKKKGVAMKDIKAFRVAADTFAAVKSGQADVIVTDEPVGYYYAKQDKATFVVSGQALAPEPVGIAVAKDSKDLHGAITQAVASMRADGTYKKLSEQWFGAVLGQSGTH